MRAIVADTEPASSGGVTPLRVFIVEDSPAIRDRLTESLSAPGRIDVVGNADTEVQAVTELNRQACDVVVLDLQLRQGNGFNVIKALRGRVDAPKLRIIVLTNYAIPQYRVRSLQLGADYFFDKAREYDRVREVLEELADSSRPSPA